MEDQTVFTSVCQCCGATTQVRFYAKFGWLKCLTCRGTWGLEQE